MVVVVVMVVMSVLVRAAVREPCAKHGDADRDHHQPGNEVEPRVEVLGNDQLRQQQRHRAQREDPRRVGDGDDAAEVDGVAHGSALADEVGGDDRLAVAGAERVRSAPEEGEGKREEDAGRAQVARDERLEARAVLLRNGRGELRRHTGRVAGLDPGARLRDRERAGEPVLGICAQLLRRAHCRRR